MKWSHFQTRFSFQKILSFELNSFNIEPTFLPLPIPRRILPPTFGTIKSVKMTLFNGTQWELISGYSVTTLGFFERSWGKISHKNSPYLITFRDFFGKHHFQVKTVLAIFWTTSEKIGLLWIAPSGHTVLMAEMSVSVEEKSFVIVQTNN